MLTTYPNIVLDIIIRIRFITLPHVFIYFAADIWTILSNWEFNLHINFSLKFYHFKRSYVKVCSSSEKRVMSLRWKGSN